MIWRRQWLLPSLREAAGSRRAKLALRGRGWGVLSKFALAFLPPSLLKHPPPPIPPTTRKGAREFIVHDFAISPQSTASLRANGSRECAPDDRLREAIHWCGNAASEEWIASSQELLAMTTETQLRDLAECFFREVFIYSRPLRIEGAGNAGRPMRPQPRVQ